MATMLFHSVKVTRDANTIIPRQVSAWELPVLEEVFGEGSVQVLEDVEREFTPPEVEPEMARLERLYGNDPQTGVPFVRSVYGTSTVGQRALKRAIDGSVIGKKGKSSKAEDEAEQKSA